MEHSIKKKLYDFASICGENPYFNDTLKNRTEMVRNLLVEFKTKSQIIKLMIEVGNHIAQELNNDEGFLDSELAPVPDEAMINMTMVVMGALWLASDQDIANGQLILKKKDEPVFKNLKKVNNQLPDDIKKVFFSREWNVIGVIAAARRCENHLNNELKGSSPELMKVKAATWSAAFGETLFLAMQNRSILRLQNVLILGESGTGKEEVATAIMEGSFLEKGKGTEYKKPCGINVAAISPDLIESTLFGYVKGAFTGAEKDTTGIIASANGGTLFLDEIGELPLHLQSKFLRVMEAGKVRRVGDSEDIFVDVRYIVATNRNIESMVKNKEFRLDFFYRLYGVCNFSISQGNFISSEQ